MFCRRRQRLVAGEEVGELGSKAEKALSNNIEEIAEGAREMGEKT